MHQQKNGGYQQPPLCSLPYGHPTVPCAAPRENPRKLGGILPGGSLVVHEITATLERGPLSCGV